MKTSGFMSRIADIDGARIHYTIGGSGPTVILLHGFVETSNMWTPILPTLAAKFTVIAADTGVKVYFCDPQSPWQRGTNENTNLLLRQYFPKGTDLSAFSQAQLDQVSLRLNQRPRKTLGFETPASKLQASVASTI